MTPNLQLGVVGNCQIAALIDSEGTVLWCCLPRPDGDPVFSALLTTEGRDAPQGIFRVEISRLQRTEQRYLHNTAVLETTLTDAQDNAVRITDFCPRFRDRGRIFRPMTFIRMIAPMAGRPLVTIRLRPATHYGRRALPSIGGSHHLRLSCAGTDYRITTDVSLTALTEERMIVIDKPIVFVLGEDETIEQAPSTLATAFLADTIGYWRDWVRTLAIPFDYQEAVIRSAITLKLCTFEDTGAVLAALTTSVPEAPNTSRNWDYRYCWLRDSYFVIQALNRLGATRTMESYLHFIDNIVARSSVDDLQPLYGISGDTRAEERIVADLAGYRGMGPVRIGNAAITQKQHDIYGSLILASTQLFFDARLEHSGDSTLFATLELLGHRARAVYEMPDAGPWELRSSERVHTFSAAMSWAGCDHLARIAQRTGNASAEERWRISAGQIRERILKRAWNEKRGIFAATFDGDEIDATALLLPELGLVSARDPRFLSTLECIDRELREGDLVFRYRHEDDFGRMSTGFVVCSFWYVNALAAAGRVQQARELFERLLARRNSLGLLSEDIDPTQGELWGNFPQTYSMVGIINSALRLSRQWENEL
jgi:GH15 family glucan-1,4-alpha-glucosidase